MVFLSKTLRYFLCSISFITAWSPLVCTSPFLVEHICDKVSRMKKAVWIIESADGFTLYRKKGEKVQRRDLPKSVVIRWIRGELYIQGKRSIESSYTLVPCNGSLVWRGTTYAGNMHIDIDATGCILRRYSPDTAPFVAPARDALDALRSETMQQKKEKVLEQIETASTKPAKIEEQKERALGVKVLLAEVPVSHTLFTITIPSGKSWALDPNVRDRFLALKGTRITVERKAKQWWVNGQKASGGTSCWVRPEGGLCGYNGTTYHGSFLFVVDKDKILIINCLELEAYVSCVLYAETWPGWPLEVNKVMAITCRTYALSMIADSRMRNKLYHIKNTNIHQMYEGAHSVKGIHEAVEQTRGMFVAYKNRPIRAMFDACCGGIVPAHVEGGLDFVGAPYLARKQACPYCKTSKVYNWETAYSVKDLIKRLQPLCPGLTTIVDITVSKRDQAGLAKTVLIKDAKRNYSVSGRKLYSLLREIKSFCYTITKHGNAVIFRGRGYGHHMGLCQWGAREMVRQGFSYPQILSFYYPGTTLMRL